MSSKFQSSFQLSLAVLVRYQSRRSYLALCGVCHTPWAALPSNSAIQWIQNFTFIRLQKVSWTRIFGWPMSFSTKGHVPNLHRSNRTSKKKVFISAKKKKFLFFDTVKMQNWKAFFIPLNFASVILNKFSVVFFLHASLWTFGQRR
jgi:hypothetical protein